MTLKDLAVDHDYYCSDHNYLSPGNELSPCFETWEEFLEEYDGDMDYNLVFRWDIKEDDDEQTEQPNGEYSLYVYFLQQRKGHFVPVQVQGITEGHIPEIVQWLRPRWELLKSIWQPISNLEDHVKAN